jgi:hydroxymethylglutaryl-CoA lyase
MLDAVLDVARPDQLGGHFHDTGGQALDNIEHCITRGLRVFDASAGGLGGCPYAPGAKGNVATEAVLERVTALGFATGLDADAVTAAGRFAQGLRS